MDPVPLLMHIPLPPARCALVAKQSRTHIVGEGEIYMEERHVLEGGDEENRRV